MKKLLNQTYVTALVLFALPVVTFAQDGLFGILGTIRGLIAALVPIIIALAVLYFLWGLLKYVTSSDSSDQAEARNTMVMGIIVLFVMISVWGLVELLADTFNIDSGSAPTNIRLIP